MLLFNLFHTAGVGDSYLILVNKDVAHLAFVLWFGLLMMIPVLANEPQPEPDRVNWGAIPARRFRKGKRW